MNITITHTLAPEILEFLKGFNSRVLPVPETIAHVENVKELPSRRVKTEKQVTPVVIPAAVVAEEAEEAEAEESFAEFSAEAETHTVEEVRAAVQKASQNGKRDGAKALLTKFDAANVTSLDPAKFAAFLTELNAL